MKCEFVDREEELEALDRAWASRPGLAIVYGRRRIGKTRLLREWIDRLPRGTPTIYYMAHLASHEYNLARLAGRLAEALDQPALAKARVPGLQDLLALALRGREALLVIDEFTYWARAEPRVVSEMQEVVDHLLPQTRSLIVLTGSLVGVVERQILGGGSPLYARSLARLRLAPLPPKRAHPLLPRMTPEERIATYALLGGIPHYLCLAQGHSDHREVFWDLFLPPHAPLRHEAELLLREEFREPTVYSTILRAIAQGYTTPARVSQATGIPLPHLSSYLSTLEALGYVGREVPLFRKKGTLYIKDPLLRTWASLVEPFQELIELGRAEAAYARALERLPQLVAGEWERLIAMHLLEKYSREGYTEAGKLVHRGEEIDVALLDPQGRRAIVAEAKWGSYTVNDVERITRRLLSKAHRLLPRGFRVERAYVAVRRVEGQPGPNVILPHHVDGTLPS